MFKHSSLFVFICLPVFFVNSTRVKRRVQSGRIGQGLSKLIDIANSLAFAQKYMKFAQSLLLITISSHAVCRGPHRYGKTISVTRRRCVTGCKFLHHYVSVRKSLLEKINMKSVFTYFTVIILLIFFF